jgi:uncharacterized alkaline shock family protein YloU
MKFFKKLGLVVFSTITLIISILLLLIAFNILEPTIFGVLISKALLTQKGTYILVGVCIVLVLLAIWCLFFGEDDSESYRKSKNAGIELENSDGRLLITKSTIEGLAYGVINKFASVLSSDVDVIIDKENNVSIDVEITVEEGTTIKDVSSKMQNEIKDVVKKSTDLELDKVNIIVKRVVEDAPAKTTEEKSSKKSKGKEANDIDD